VPILRDVTEEAERLVLAASAAGVTVRLLGGTAIRLHLGGDPHSAFVREIQDIDVVARKGDGRRLSEFLEQQGYAPNRQFNATNGARRLLFYDEQHSRQLDVFIETFEMCHVLPVAEHLDRDPLTLPLADLLLTKLQVVSLNAKDRSDAYALLLEHEIGDGGSEQIAASRIAELCARDWGLNRTLELNFERLRAALPTSSLDEGEQTLIASRIVAIEDASRARPKSVKWRARARVGDRVRWYEEPDEVEQGG
jgi:Uncharacterised nucleotidyltransferase